MRKYTLTITLVLVMLAGMASAQSPIPVKFYGGVGISSPMKPVDFEKFYKRGFNGMLGVSLPVFPAVEALGKVQFVSFGEDTDEYEGGKLKMVLYGVDGKATLSLPGFPVAPYVIGGIGWAKVSQDEWKTAQAAVSTALSLQDQTEFYFDFGFGAQWKFAPMVNVFGQIQWTDINTSADTPAFKENARFWSLMVGLRLL